MRKSPLKRTSQKNSDQSKFDRSKSENKIPTNTFELCAVCLSELSDDYVFLNCNHKLCSQDCARGWWKFNAKCPYCREEITFIETKSGRKIVQDQISEQPSSDDSNFIPTCVQCWADISEDEQKRICFTCSSNFIHTRCVVFKSKFWRCNSCLENVDSQGKEIYPTIPYNPIFHYLFIKNFK